MQRNRVIFLFALVIGQLHAADLEGDLAIRRFIRPIVKQHLDKNVGAWEWEVAGNGGYIFRMKADVTGDGREEIFLSSSLSSVKSVVQWTVFDVNDKGVYSPYADTVRVFFNGAWPSQDPAKPGLITTGIGDREARRTIPDDQRQRAVMEFTFSFPKISEVSEDLPDKQMYEVEEKNKSFVPKVEAILLSDFLEGKNGWDVVEHWHSNIDDKFKREDDWERALEKKQFTAEAALASLDTVREPARPEVEKKTEVNQLPAKHEDDSQVDGSFLEKPVGWITLIGIVLIGGIFFIRRTKNNNQRSHASPS